MEGLKTKGEFFVDKHQRTVLLRGINLGGDSKVPYPNGGTFQPTDFSDHKTVSFIGRPFPLKEADQHFLRLKDWGFNCLRLLTTWEAVEHQGPGEYDEDYLDYFESIVKKACEFGFYIFVDFHQDVWSRMTGGDGAPGWIFERIGMDISKISSSDSALVMQAKYDFSKPGTRQESNYPTMCWAQNYRYPANAILWTLFFAGRDFAPNFMLDGLNVQDYLQKHYLGCIKKVGEKIKKYDQVLGFDSLNEPGKGFIGLALNDRCLTDKPHDPAKPGLAWSPIDALYASHGFSVEIPFLKLSLLRRKFHPIENRIVNPNKVSLWLSSSLGDPFQLEGAWSLSKDGFPFVEKNDYFQVVKGKQIDFDRDYMIPFIRSVGETVASIREDWLVFAEREAGDGVLSPDFKAKLPTNAVNATHWYDFSTLVFKRFLYPVGIDPIFRRLAFGTRGITEMYKRQLSRIKSASAKVPGKIPTLIGEFGIPFDLKGGTAFRQWRAGNRSKGIWRSHTTALSCMYDAMDSLFLNATLWNYTASNRNDLMIGDQWNQEDLSVYSKDQELSDCEPDLYGGGGRAIEGFARPFARKIQGLPLEMKFHWKKGEFYFRFEADPNIDFPTEIFLPRIHFPKGYKTYLSSGLRGIESSDPKILHVQAIQAGVEIIRVLRT